MSSRRPLSLAIILAVVMILLLIVVAVGWVLLSVLGVMTTTGRTGLYWTLLSVGSTFIVLLVVGVVMYLALSVKAINLTRRQSNFVDSVTHELKSPIASLKLYLQTLNRRQLSGQDLSEFYRAMLEDVERLDHLINQVLATGRAEAGYVDGEAEDVSLGPLLTECAEMACLRYRVPKDTVRLDLAPCAVRGRSIDLDMIFRNLLDNAVKYAGPQPLVEVTTRLDDGWAVVRICDNGRGIPAQSRRKIFGRFVRLGSELEREKPGTGLGLYIVRTLVRRLRGSVRAGDRPAGTGALFEVKLPGRKIPALARIANTMANGKHILVIEDELHLATGIKYNLEAEGYRVTAMGDGRSALKFIEANRRDVDLVVLDLMLPGMSGYAVCEALRAADEMMPILILSARTLAEDRTRGFEVGADQYMLKPFDLDEFLSRIKSLLAMYARRVEHAARRPDPLVSYAFGNVVIHFDTFEVTVDGQPVRMTQLELKLLRYFVENEGRIVSRRELLENVWDLPGHLNTRAPDQFIRRLRKAFEPEPARPRHFLTLRDAGYRFVAKPDENRA